MDGNEIRATNEIICITSEGENKQGRRETCVTYRWVERKTDSDCHADGCPIPTLRCRRAYPDTFSIVLEHWKIGQSSNKPSALFYDSDMHHINLICFLFDFPLLFIFPKSNFGIPIEIISNCFSGPDPGFFPATFGETSSLPGLMTSITDSCTPFLGTRISTCTWYLG